MSSVSTFRQMLRRADPATTPANDMRPREMTLDDLEANLEDARQRVGRTHAELEARMQDLDVAEAALIERIGPILRRHKIVPMTQEEIDAREDEE